MTTIQEFATFLETCGEDAESQPIDDDRIGFRSGTTGQQLIVSPTLCKEWLAENAGHEAFEFVDDVVQLHQEMADLVSQLLEM